MNTDLKALVSVVAILFMASLVTSTLHAQVNAQANATETDTNTTTATETHSSLQI
jgi:hypothetical protein